jgi:hypothetical protein
VSHQCFLLIVLFSNFLFLLKKHNFGRFFYLTILVQVTGPGCSHSQEMLFLRSRLESCTSGKSKVSLLAAAVQSIIKKMVSCVDN